MADKVKISDSTSTTSSIIAASLTAVKSAYDKAVSAYSKATTAMKGATSSDAGAAGIVPAPAAGKQASFLRGDGTWVVPTNTTYKAATTSALGLVKIGSNISVSNGIISLSKSNVTSALGYTPPENTGITTVKGEIGSSVTSNGTSMTLPNGGTWFVWNIGGTITYPGAVTSSSLGVSNSSSGYTYHGTTYAGGTKVYGRVSWSYHGTGDDGDDSGIITGGNLVAIRIS